MTTAQHLHLHLHSSIGSRHATDYDAAAAASDSGRLGALDAAFNQHLGREIAESKVESAQARQEIREDKRELRTDRRELRQDRRDLADDRADARDERLSRQRLLQIQSQLGGLAGRFDGAAVAQKRALYGEVLTAALRELRGDVAERREDQGDRRH